ncbi:hypothetical protein KR038_011931, partial [Drosophila bunnanda]
YGGVFRRPCFGGQLKRNQSQKSPKTEERNPVHPDNGTTNQQTTSIPLSPSWRWINTSPGQQRQPSWQGLKAEARLSY